MNLSEQDADLLLYLESCCVDDFGLVEDNKLVSDEKQTLAAWVAWGFVKMGFASWSFPSQDVPRQERRERNSKGRYVVLTEEAWAEAGRLRRERAARLWTQKLFKTEEEV